MTDLEALAADVVDRTREVRLSKDILARADRDLRLAREAERKASDELYQAQQKLLAYVERRS